MEEQKKYSGELPEATTTTEPSPIEQATAFLKGGGDLASLEKMMDLQERWEKGEAKKAFFSAMVKTQKEMPVVFEGRKNAQTSSTYAAYKDVARFSKPIYSSHGLSVSFYEVATEKEGYVKYCADVYHEEGHSQTYSLSLPIDDTGPKGTKVKTQIHGIKSAMSYGRGMLLCSIFNIPTSSDRDDDGNAAGSETITEEQAIELREIIESLENTSEETFCSWAKVKTLEDIPVYDFGKCKLALKGKVKAEVKK